MDTLPHVVTRRRPMPRTSVREDDDHPPESLRVVTEALVLDLLGHRGGASFLSELIELIEAAGMPAVGGVLPAVGGLMGRGLVISEPHVIDDEGTLRAEIIVRLRQDRRR